MKKYSVRYFNNKEVRAIWDYENSKWWYSATDIIAILVNPKSPRRYWYNTKVRNPELSPYCGQQKLIALDGKKYNSEVISEEGIKLLITLIPTKYKKETENWLKGFLDPLDEQSKKKAYDLFKTNLVNEDEIGTTLALQKIHAYLFEGLYPFAGKIRTKNISKGGFMFANAEFLQETLNDIEKMPDATFNEIVDKYIEMNIAHPFLEGNGRATRIWLDLLLKDRLKKCIDWSKIEKDVYLAAMKKSPYDSNPIFNLLEHALTRDINNREVFLKGIDYSYYYEEEE
ncbi:MAG: protein adenylyltransferase Fic [Bacilli bacterium]|jgi:cell filamentation protein